MNSQANIDSSAVYQFCGGLEIENRQLKQRVEYLESNSVIADKFYNVPLDVATVAKMHSVSEELVRKYIRLGLIDTHPKTTAGKMFIRGSEALLIDFKKLKHINRASKR